MGEEVKYNEGPVLMQASPWISGPERTKRTAATPYESVVCIFVLLKHICSFKYVYAMKTLSTFSTRSA